MVKTSMSPKSLIILEVFNCFNLWYIGFDLYKWGVYTCITLYYYMYIYIYTYVYIYIQICLFIFTSIFIHAYIYIYITYNLYPFISPVYPLANPPSHWAIQPVLQLALNPTGDSSWGASCSYPHAFKSQLFRFCSEYVRAIEFSENLQFWELPKRDPNIEAGCARPKLRTASVQPACTVWHSFCR